MEAPLSESDAEEVDQRDHVPSPQPSPPNLPEAVALPQLEDPSVQNPKSLAVAPSGPEIRPHFIPSRMTLESFPFIPSWSAFLRSSGEEVMLLQLWSRKSNIKRNIIISNRSFGTFLKDLLLILRFDLNKNTVFSFCSFIKIFLIKMI